MIDMTYSLSPDVAKRSPVVTRLGPGANIWPSAAMFSVSVALFPSTPHSVYEELAAYRTETHQQTYSHARETIGASLPKAEPNFSQKLSEVYEEFSRVQEPLGAEFVDAWNANLAELYGA